MRAIDTHVEERLVPFFQGELEPADRLLVEGHLATCAACRAARADFERLASDLARPAPPPVHWGAYRAQLRDRLGRRAARPAPGRAWRFRPLPVALAAGLVAILVYLGVPGFGGRGPGNGELAAIENSILVSRLDLISRLDLVQRLDLLEDFDVIRRLDGLPQRREG